MHLDPMCSNRLTRICSKAPALMLQPHRMHQLNEAILVELVSSGGLLAISYGSTPPDLQLLEQEIKRSH
jgi:hypothetical protein